QISFRQLMSSQGYTLLELLKTTLAAAVAVVAATVVCAKPKKTVAQTRDVPREKSKSSESVTPGGSSSASKSKGDKDPPKENAPKTQKPVLKQSAEKTAVPKQQELSKKNLELVTCEDQVILSVIQPPPVDLSQVPQEVRERLNITRTQEKEDDDKDTWLPLVKTQDITPSMEIDIKGSTPQEQQKVAQQAPPKVTQQEQPKVTQQEPQKVTQQEQPKVTQQGSQKVIPQEPQKVINATNGTQPAVITVNKVAPPAQHHVYKPTTYVTAIAGRTGPQILQGPVPPPEAAATQPTPTATERKKVAPLQPTMPSATQTSAPAPQPAPMKQLPISTAPRVSVPVAPSSRVGSKPGLPGGPGAAQPQMASGTKPIGSGGAQPQTLAKAGVSEALQNQMVPMPGASGSAKPQMLTKPGAVGAVQPQMSMKPASVNKYTASPRPSAISYVAKTASANVQVKPASTVLGEQNKLPPAAIGTTTSGVTVNQAGASKQSAAPNPPAPLSFPTTTPAPQTKEPLLEATEPPKPTEKQPSLANKTVGKPTPANQPGIQPSLTKKPPSVAQPPGMPKPTS
ncbi:hypothetical protein GCK32_010599, partial [Trichostrongylus colubriformis]